MPVASLTRLSPSRIVTMRRGTPRRWATVVAAMASVGETIAPRTKAATHGIPMTVWTTAATPKVVISTSPTASSEIGLMLARKSRHDVKSAETYSSGGKNNRNTSADPPRTSRIGYGTPSRVARVASAATARSRPRIISSWGNAHVLGVGSDKTLCHELCNIGIPAEFAQEPLYLFALHISAKLF